MADRYTRVHTFPNNMYCTGAPVIISAGALLKDNQTGKILVQLKIKNIVSKKIKALKLEVKSFDTIGNELAGDTYFEYLDLSVNRDEEFGQKTLILLPNASTRSASVNIIEVDFSDNSAWRTKDGKYESIHAQQSLAGKLGDKELVRQYKMHLGTSAQFYPFDYKDLWFCTCGSVNNLAESECHRCSLSYAKQKQIKIEELKKEMNERLAKAAEAAALRAAENEAQERKIKKFVLWACGILAVIIMINLILSKIVIPASKYNKAASLANSGAYEEAIEIYEELGKYKDCQDRIPKTIFDSAMSQIAQDNYSGARSEITKLSNYGEAAAEYIDKAEKSIIAIADVGDTICFGHYEQDNNIPDGNEMIEWVVLESNDDELKLISKYCLDVYFYSASKRREYRFSDMKNWMGNEFVTRAFDDDDLENIAVKEENIGPSSNCYIAQLPSYSDVESMSRESRVGILTDYLRSYIPDNFNVTYSQTESMGWWLYNGDMIDSKGDRLKTEDNDLRYYLTVRPMIYIKK